MHSASESNLFTSWATTVKVVSKSVLIQCAEVLLWNYLLCNYLYWIIAIQDACISGRANA